MDFQLIPKSSTLDDLEQPISILLQKRCVFGSHHKILNEDTSTLSGTKMLDNDSSFGNINYLKIFEVFSWRTVVKPEWSG